MCLRNFLTKKGKRNNQDSFRPQLLSKVFPSSLQGPAFTWFLQLLLDLEESRATVHSLGAAVEGIGSAIPSA